MAIDPMILARDGAFDATATFTVVHIRAPSFVGRADLMACPALQLGGILSCCKSRVLDITASSNAKMDVPHI